MSATGDGTAGERYQPHVDGLRAIAVLAVIAYHLHAAWLPGGFTGVDVFFVISGYVVATAMHGASRHPRQATIGAFYVRRLRRIAPALVACLLASGIAAVLFVPPAWLGEASDRTALFAFVGLGNLVLARSAGDYFSPSTEYNPFAHTWSLGVEEQFYLVFPLLFLAWLRGGRWRTASVVLFAAGAFASLGYAWQRSVSGAGTDAFYLLPGRFWQLALGVLLYQWLATREVAAGRSVPSGTRRFAAWLCFALLLGGVAFARGGHTPWPDGLWPVLGTLGVLAWLHDDAGRSLLARGLASAPMAGIGRLSYSLYLWHWPVFVLFRWTVGLDAPVQKGLALLLAVLLAIASYHLVERPLRRARWGGSWPRAAWIAGAILLLVAAGYSLRLLQKQRAIVSQSVVVRHAQDWYPEGLGTRPDPFGCRIAERTRNAGADLRFDYSRTDCEPPATARRVLVLGDSHALGYRPMLHRHMLATGDEVVLWHRTGCGVLNLNRAPEQDSPDCAEAGTRFLQQALQQARAGDVLFLASLRVQRLVEQWQPLRQWPAAPEEDLQRAADAAREALEPFLARGVHVVLEAPKPVLPAPPYRCSDWFNAKNPICAGGLATTRAQQEAHRAPVMRAFGHLTTALPQVQVWDPLPLLCDQSFCGATHGGRPIFFDGDHLSGYGNELLAPVFTRRLGLLPAPANQASEAPRDPTL